MIATALLAAAFLFQVLALFLPHRKAVSMSARALMLAAALIMLALIVQRSLRWSFPALTTTYEALLLLIAVTLLILALHPRLSSGIRLSGLSVDAVLWLLASSPLISAASHPPVPALQSGWLILHIALTLIGEAFFLAAAVTSLLGFISGNKREQLAPLTYRLVLAGYPLYTAGALIFGAVWAWFAWGRFWGWDPKETWALVTWLIYTAYLHQRLISQRENRWVQLMPFIGFLAALFTFLGVNFLLAGLHSYG